MHSISNLMKFNKINNEILNFEKMSLDELKNHQKKFISIKSNTKLINCLKDKGEKIDQNLRIIQELIQNLENKKNEKQEPGEDLQILVDKMDTLEFDREKSAQEEIEKVQRENYFSRISLKSERKSEKNIDVKKLNEIKAKIKINIDKQFKYKESKEIPVDEAFKLLKEHEKRIQECQMKQAAERLLMGQSVKYEFSFLEKSEKENLVYRENVREFDDEDDEDDDVEGEQFFDDEFYSGVGIDKIHKSEKMKYKQYSDELEKVD